ncbi:MAG: DUF4097 family beta strand repeat protein [Gemmatimonadetes bacterium]|nr:DUF4097 family beta strand repeat protein [Gemmatimonadota bacterium]
MTRFAASALAAAALIAAAAPGHAQDFRWSGRLAPGKAIEVVTVVGDVRAVPSSGNTVEAVAEMEGGTLPVRVVEHEDGVTLCVVYPTSGGRGRIDSGDHCSQNGNLKDPPQVDFTVRVPAGVRFVGRTVQGDVRAEALRSPVRASTVSGSVDVRTSEEAQASSVSGDLRVSMGRLPRSGTLRFSTVSGDVRLTLPASVGAELRLNTLSGEIDSEFPLMVTARGSRNGGSRVRIGQKVEATLGRGGPTIDINTVSGDVELNRGS